MILTPDDLYTQITGYFILSSQTRLKKLIFLKKPLTNHKTCDIIIPTYKVGRQNKQRGADSCMDFTPDIRSEIDVDVI